MRNTYKVIQSDPGAALFAGMAVTPYYEDDKEMILEGPQGMHHHVKKDGTYFTEHFEIGGKSE